MRVRTRLCLHAEVCILILRLTRLFYASLARDHGRMYAPSLTLTRLFAAGAGIFSRARHRSACEYAKSLSRGAAGIEWDLQ